MATERMKQFAFEFVKDFDPARAYERAGYSADGSASGANRLLQNVEVQELIEGYKEQAARVSRITRAWVLDQWYQIATADPRELSAVRVAPCPNCWPAELKKLCEDPNIACNTCAGAGIRSVWVTDSRKLSPSAALLYSGAVQTKDGIKILTRDRDGALKSIANYFGMEKTQLSGPGGGPIPLQAVAADLSLLSDEALARVISSGKESLQLGVSSGVSSEGGYVTLEGQTG